MNPNPNLSEEEWALVVDLLQRELHDLPAEIHHTRSSGYREDLHRRIEMVKDLLKRITL